MADLKMIYILHTTSTEENADTDADFQLIAGGDDPHFDYRKTFDDWPHDHNEREKGHTDEYRFNVNNRGVTTESPLKIRMTSTSDGWLPKSIWAIGETTSGEFVVLGHHPEWNKGWFDRGSSNHKEEHRIDN